VIQLDMAEYMKMARDAKIVASNRVVGIVLAAPVCLPMDTPTAEAAAKSMTGAVAFPE
jgi:hypothetical protein